MTTLSVASLLLFSFLLGLKHATEPDHLAAVSTIVSERKSVWSSFWIGGLWGVGHTISLLIAGVLVIVLHFEIGPRMALALEFAVGLMLIGLGCDALIKAIRGGQIHWHVHRHGEIVHMHPHTHDATNTHSSAQSLATQSHHGLKLSPRPLIVGMIHGLAGSGALMLLILSTITSPVVGTVYILIFGAGSIGGMMLMSALIGLPFHLTVNRLGSVKWLLRGGAGLFSLGFGIFMVIDIGYTQELFMYR